MDVFKLAFETTVVGLLTISWLAVAAYLLFPEFNFDTAVDDLPDFLKNNPTALGIGALTLAYCLGSAVLPVAKQLVNDEHWPLNERAIRCQVFTKEDESLESVHDTAFPKDKTFLQPDTKPAHCSYWGVISTHEDIGLGERLVRFFRLWVGRARGQDSDDDKIAKLLTVFEQEEAAVLRQSSDKTEGLRQLHERIVVLQGTVFSGFLLFLICLFAHLARVNGSANWVRPTCGILVALALIVFAGFNGYQDLTNRDIFDIPVLESVLVAVAVFGVVLVIKKPKSTFHSKRYVLIALFFFTALAYGGWVASEISYDQQITSSYLALQNRASVPKE